MLRGDIVKDDSGAYAVFTEEGSCASQMIAAKVMDVIARLPDCDGQAADAISAYTQVNLEDAPRLLRIPKSECPDVWIRLPRQKRPQNEILYGHPLAALLCGRPFEEVLLELGWEKEPNLESLFVNRKQRLFLSVDADDIKMAGKKQNMARMWKNLMNNVDLDEPTSFLDHVYLGCTQRECKQNEIIIEECTNEFESRISAGAT